MLILLVLLILLIAPSFFMMRKQKQREGELRNLQSSLTVGDHVVTAAGLHGHVAGIDGEEIALEVAPDVITTWDRASILRKVTEERPEAVEAAGAPAEGSLSEELPAEEPVVEDRPGGNAQNISHVETDGVPDSGAQPGGSSRVTADEPSMKDYPKND